MSTQPGAGRRIGSVLVFPVVDGEIPGPPGAMYPDVPAEELAAAVEGYVDPTTGKFVFTIGAYLLVMPDGRRILIDTGIGPRPTPPAAGGGLRSTLLSLGIAPEDITDVVFTHLHFDHIGWATQDGVPVFPNAVYRVERRDWEHFMAADYVPADFEHYATNLETDAARVRLAPIANRVVLWDGSGEVVAGICARDAAGHTPGTTLLLIESEGSRGALLGDIAHSIPELLGGWRFRSHLDGPAAVRSLVAVRDYLADEGLLCSGSHFPGLAWGYVRRHGDGYTWEHA